MNWRCRFGFHEWTADVGNWKSENPSDWFGPIYCKRCGKKMEREKK